MKICIIFPKDSIGFFLKDSGISFGGATVQLHRIATAIYGMKKDITALIPGSRRYREQINVGYRVKDPYKANDFILFKFFKLSWFLLRKNPGVILQRGLTFASLIFSFLCWLKGTKFVFMFAHDVETEGYYQNSRKKILFFRMLLFFSHRLICQSDRQFQNIPHRYREKTHIIKKGIPIIESITATKEFDAAWIGRCERWKNPEAFIDLALINPSHKFIMITNRLEKSAKYFNHIRKAALEAGNIEFITNLPNDEIFAYLHKTKLLCITSDVEGDWPMTVLEAASCGLPVLSLHFDNDHFLSKYKAGFFCEGSLEKMNRHFRTLMKDRSTFRKMSQAAREYIRKKYNIEKNVKKLLSIIQQ